MAPGVPCPACRCPAVQVLLTGDLRCSSGHLFHACDRHARYVPGPRPRGADARACTCPGAVGRSGGSPQYAREGG